MIDTGPMRYDTIDKIAIDPCFGPFAARDDPLSFLSPVDIAVRRTPGAI